VVVWRQELLAALDDLLNNARGGQGNEWRPLGRIGALPESGWYAVDTKRRKGPGAADNFEQVCISDREGPDRGAHVPVERVQVADDVLKVKVDGPVPAGCDTLWTVRLTPQHLTRKLREGIAAIERADLADKLAAGRLDRLSHSADRDYPPGFLPRQRSAYRACVEPGLHAVWGPPGTGKTRVLARAIEDLVRDGKRVLLVSTANVAVDNALVEVIKNLRPVVGQVIRVGPPHLPELVADDDVQLQRLAARTTTAVERELAQVQTELAMLAASDTRIAKLVDILGDFDEPSYRVAVERVDRAGRLGAADLALRVERERLKAAAHDLAEAITAAESAQLDRTRVEPNRIELDRADRITAALSSLDRELAAQRSAVHAKSVAAEHGGWLARRRAAATLDAARRRLAELEAEVVRRHAEDGPMVRACLAAANPITAQDIADRDAAVARTRSLSDYARHQVDVVRRTIDELESERVRCVSEGIATEADNDLVTRARRRELPAKAAELAGLRTAARADRRARQALEERLRGLSKRITDLRRDAEGQIIAGAKVVATTLARSRAHPALARERFDVVMVDEAGAAMLGEVLFAVSRATRTAVLLGDFLQLGPVLAEVDKSKHPMVKRWMTPDPFTHCGIRAPQDAEDTQGAVALLQQFRFGSNLRELANKVVYGVLEDGITAVSGKPPPDTEIVVIDVGDLPDLALVHRSATYAGWWPVGALLARALVEHHAAEGGTVGVVTTFKQQAEAVHATLCDVGQNLTTPVGTAHSFQGREFDTVVFDLVEDGAGWIANARWDGSDFQRSGVRLFGVGITRARRRLYIIAHRDAVRGAQLTRPLGAVNKLVGDRRIKVCRAGVLLGMADTTEYKPVSDVEGELNEVLRGLVDVSDIHDEFSFDEALRAHLGEVRRSLWMWSPWVGTKSAVFIPLIRDAVARGVDVTVFTRDDKDFIMRNPSGQRWLAELRATGAKIIRARVEHRKVVVVDEGLVLLGSHNPLSQRGSREVMLACRGAAFAKRLLDELRAADCADPVPCTKCGEPSELWRSADKKKGRLLFWRCHPCGFKTPVLVKNER